MPTANDKLKVCFVINSLVGGGAERVVLTLADALHKEGCYVCLIVLEDTPPAYEISQYQFEIRFLKRIPRPIGFIYPLKSLQVMRFLRELDVKFDMYISNLLMSDFAMRLLNLPNKYSVIHNNLVASTSLEMSTRLTWISMLKRSLIYRLLARVVYDRQHLIAISEGVKKGIESYGIKAASITIINNPFDFDIINKSSNEYNVEEKNYIVTVGRFDRQKRQDIALSAFAKSGISGKIMFIGDHNNSYGSYVKGLAVELGMSDRVVFCGFVKNPYPFMKHAKALILSSDFEGLPTVLIEALYLGTPVASTDCDFGPREIMIEPLDCYLSETGNSSDLAAKIVAAVNSKEVESALMLRFSSGSIVQKYMRLVNDRR